MQILFDHQTFRLQRYGGISLYVSKLINGINQSSENDAQLTIPDFENENLPQTPTNRGLGYMNLWRMMPRKGRRVSNIFSLYALKAKPYDVFHATYYDTYFLKGLTPTKPWTFTYHDMTLELLGDRFPPSADEQRLLDNKKRLAQRAPIVIAISECTKQDLIDRYRIDPARIRVIHHGNPYEHLMLSSEPTVSAFDFSYLLFVGNRWSYKNFSLCLRAIAPLLRRYDIHLVCAGGDAFTPEEQLLFKTNAVSSLVHYQPIRNQDLPNLYRHALSFLFPSMYEGFGLPILEAFTCGCPCVLSNKGALPEVAGPEAALYFDPDDIDSITSAVETVILGGEALRKQLTERGRERLKSFSWQKTIQETIDVYRQLIA